MLHIGLGCDRRRLTEKFFENMTICEILQIIAAFIYELLQNVVFSYKNAANVLKNGKILT